VFYNHNTSSQHPDEYAHQHAEQAKSNTWYFHGSGLDITFGDKEIYGGILIRSIGLLKMQKDFNAPFDKVVIGQLRLFESAALLLFLVFQ
jgi:hypothetical protein